MTKSNIKTTSDKRREKHTLEERIVFMFRSYGYTIRWNGHRVPVRYLVEPITNFIRKEARLLCEKDKK